MKRLNSLKWKEGEKRERERRGRERDKESMWRGKERNRAKRDRNSNIIGVVKKYFIGEEMGKKGVIKVQNPYSILTNRCAKTVSLQ